MTVVICALFAFGIDLLLGDPEELSGIHPVVLIGKCISALEKLLRKLFPSGKRGEQAAGTVMAAAIALGTLIFSGAVLWALGKIWMPLSVIVQVIWCWQALAVKNLADESKRVYKALNGEGLEAARKAVARIVGRDTQALSEEGVAKAAVETVAENFSDGVVSPMVYMLLGGAPLALTYKAINTMDSMLGYKNDRYLWFGRIPAKLDDAANFIPSRFSALLLIAAAAVTGQNVKGAWTIWRRDRRNHASPNSAQSEAAAAGALNVQLGGPAYYFGKLVQKPTIGDAVRPVELADILRTNRMMFVGSGLCMALLCAVRWLIFRG